DAILVELDDLGIDPRGETALSAIEVEDPFDVRPNRGPGEDLPRRKLYLRQDLVFLESLVALEDDAVDDRVLANVDDEVAGFGTTDVGIGEEIGRVEILERLIESRPGIGLAGRQIGVGADRFRLESLVALDGDGPDGPLDRRRGWRRRGLRSRRCGRRRLLRLGCLGRKQWSGGSAEHGADQKQAAGAPAKSRRP